MTWIISVGRGYRRRRPSAQPIAQLEQAIVQSREEVIKRERIVVRVEGLLPDGVQDEPAGLPAIGVGGFEAAPCRFAQESMGHTCPAQAAAMLDEKVIARLDVVAYVEGFPVGGSLVVVAHQRVRYIVESIMTRDPQPVVVIFDGGDVFIEVACRADDAPPDHRAGAGMDDVLLEELIVNIASMGGLVDPRTRRTPYRFDAAVHESDVSGCPREPVEPAVRPYGKPLVVGVKKRDELPSRLLDAAVAGGADPTVDQLDEVADARVGVCG